MEGSLAGYSSKKDIQGLVNRYLEFLNEAAGKEAFDDPLVLTGVQRRSFWQNDQGDALEEYFGRGSGIVPASAYSGFYYTSADRPVGYEGSPWRLAATGQGGSGRSRRGTTGTTLKK